MLKSFAKLFAGNIAVQVITLAFYPVLGRIYTPSEFGLFGTISSVAVVLSIVCSGQLHMAFPQVSNRFEDGISLLRLCLIYTCSLMVLIFLLSAIGSFDFLIERKNNYTWLFIPFFTLSYTFNEITKMWLVYLRRYGLSSVMNSSNRLFSNVLKVISPKYLGLLISEILTNMLFVSLSLKITKVSFSKASNLLKTFKHYSSYPGFYTFGCLAQAFQSEIPVFMLKKFYTSQAVGLFVLANKFTVQSVLLVSASLVLVMANQEHKRSESSLTKVLLRILYFAIPGTITLFLLLSYFGEGIFEVFLGSDWKGVGNISKWLSLLILPKVVFIPIYAEVLRTGKVRLLSLLRCSQVLIVVLFFYLSQGWSFLEVIQGYVMIDFFTDLAVTSIIYFKLNSSKKDGSIVSP